MGLSFSVASHVRPIPRSLQNIYAELEADLGIRPAASGDLIPWFQQGVLLLNRVLTVQPGRSGSHRGKGWEQVTQRAIEALVARGGPLVAILWGRDAQSLIPMLGSVPYLASAHPSPLSAAAGFFGSRPFSRANELLVRAGGEPVDWALKGTPDFASRAMRKGPGMAFLMRRLVRRFRSCQARALSKSAIRSSASSMPTLSRIRSSGTSN